MKAGIVDKLTLIIETTSGNDISKDVMKSIASLQRTVAAHKEMKLSLSVKEEQHSSIDNYCPAGWNNYWPM